MFLQIQINWKTIAIPMIFFPIDLYHPEGTFISVLLYGFEKNSVVSHGKETETDL